MVVRKGLGQLFACKAFSSALREFEAAYNYSHASATEARAIEADQAESYRLAREFTT